MIRKHRMKRLNESAGIEDIERFKKDIENIITYLSDAKLDPVDAWDILDFCEQGKWTVGKEWWASNVFSNKEQVEMVHEVVKEMEEQGRMGDLVFISDIK